MTHRKTESKGPRMACCMGVILAGLTAGWLTGCSKNDPASTQGPAPSDSSRQNLPTQTPPIPGDSSVIVPEAARGRWRAVKLRVQDRQAESYKDYVVTIGSELIVQESVLVVEVMHFLPDLKLEGNVFTSASAELLNPSVHIRVLENGKEIFNGWLFQLFPTIHPFQHGRYSITLMDSIAQS